MLLFGKVILVNFFFFSLRGLRPLLQDLGNFDDGSYNSEPLCSPGSYLKDLCEDADKDNSGTITAEEFLKALVTGKVAFNYLKESLNKGVKEMKQNECDPWQSNNLRTW